MTAVRRTLAGAAVLAGLPVLWYGGFVALLGIAVAAEGPRPGVPDGDPCCGHADTWGGVAAYGAGGLAAWAVVAGVVLVQWRLASYALVGWTPRLRWRHLPVAAIATALLYAAVLLGITLATG